MQTTFFRKRVFVLAAVERPTSRFSTKSPDIPLVRIVSGFVLLSSAGVCFCSYPTICKARPVDLPMQSIFPQEGRAGYTRYNGDHTPNAVDCRSTPSSVSTLAVMAARGYWFLECFSWRWKRVVIDTILRRCIGYRSRDVLRRLSSGPAFMQFDRRALQVIGRDSEVQVRRRCRRTVWDVDCTSEDSGRNRTIFSSCHATERASSYWRRHVRCATVVYQERH
jgi:hypothetical protein